MKLVPFIVSVALALTGVAHADAYGPPPGAYGPPPGGQPAPMVQQRQRPRGQLRQALLATFDRNHDGRLEPNERRHALRVLRRLERRLARGEGRGMRDPAARAARRARLDRIIQRYDLNGDGNVDQGEMAPDMARRLRPLDRNGDGWVDPARRALV